MCVKTFEMDAMWHLQPMMYCNLEVLPSDTSPQFFYRIPVDEDSFCLESTLKQGHLICVEGSRVFLEETTADDVKTHFSRRRIYSWIFRQFFTCICSNYGSSIISQLPTIVSAKETLMSESTVYGFFQRDSTEPKSCASGNQGFYRTAAGQ